MAATLATIDSYLKEVYQGRIREQLNDEIVALKRITRSGSGVTNEVGGKYVTFPIHTRRNSGIGSRFESEALPTPGQQGHAAARVGLKYAYGGVQLTGQAISLSDTDAKAFAKALDNEVEGLKNDLKKDMNRQVYGSGNGAIAVATGANTGAVVPVADARLFQVGMVVDTQTGNTVDNTGLIVASVDLTAGSNTVTFTTTPGTATAAADIIVRKGSGVAAGGNRELTGLAAIVSDSGTLYNIDPSVEPEWKANVDSNGGTNRALSEALMIGMTDDIRTKGGSTSLILQSLGVRRAYFNLLSQLRQTVNTQEFTGGFSGLAFTTDRGEIPVVADVDAPLNKQWYINEDALTYYRDEDWHFIDRDGSMWKQVSDSNGDYDAYYARMVEYHELATDRRNTHGLVSDITEA
tara:strand:+ start:2073 stop:3293 length:1221 start_codon:yes stop_codon:yes gene_type:complete